MPGGCASSLGAVVAWGLAQLPAHVALQIKDGNLQAHNQMQAPAWAEERADLDGVNETQRFWCTGLSGPETAGQRGL